MGDIDFLSPNTGDDKNKKDVAANARRGVEYTHGERLDGHGKEKNKLSVEALSSVARVTPAIPLPLASPKPKPERHLFSWWRRSKKSQLPPVPKIKEVSVPLPKSSEEIVPVPKIGLGGPKKIEYITKEHLPDKPKDHHKKEKMQFTHPVDHSVDNGMMDVNLIPAAASAAQKASISGVWRTLIVAGMLALAFVVIAEGGIIFYRYKINVNISDTEVAIIDADQKIAKLQPLKNMAEQLNAQLEGLHTVTSRHVYWIPFFNFLEENTMPTVYYESMVASATSGEVILSARATDYQQIAAQVKILERARSVESVEVNGAALEGSATAATNSKTAPAGEVTATVVNPARVSFRLQLKLKTELFSALNL